MLLLQSLSYKDAFPQTMALPSVASGKSNRRLSYPSSGIWLIFWLVFTFPNNLQSENQKGWQRLQRLPLLSDTAALQDSGEQQRTKLLDVRARPPVESPRWPVSSRIFGAGCGKALYAGSPGLARGFAEPGSWLHLYRWRLGFSCDG